MSAFTETVMRKVYVRQKGRCALCGENLQWLMENTAMHSVQYHHVLPRMLDGEDSEDNCVVLCSDTDPVKGDSSKDGCHYRVHADGRYRSGVVAGPEMYIYSHGHEFAKHQLWVRHVKESRFK
ncbi:HNH endonuclease [Paraburkholderia fungorum]|uniref:HNH endonuclease n=2 Tax=Paraburkholderia fungorum TaxID=134537 RepID=UPI0038B927DD